MWKKKEYIKPITEAIIEDTWCQMLSGSGNSIISNANTGKDSVVNIVGGDEYVDGGDDDGLEAAKINYWLLENTVLGGNN